jgi:hypothetical protein
MVRLVIGPMYLAIHVYIYMYIYMQMQCKAPCDAWLIRRAAPKLYMLVMKTLYTSTKTKGLQVCLIQTSCRDKPLELEVSSSMACSQ